MEIRAFCGWRYAGGEVSNLIAPPYDVLDQNDKDQLLSRSPYNIVAVDMPFVPPKALGPDEVYQQAARRLAQWQAEGVLVQENSPAIYAYEQTYSWAGKTYHRRAMLCGVRATALGEDVIPHEHTFDGPKADRLKLTQCTDMQLSPIFGFFDDSKAGASKLLWDAARGEPDLQGELKGVIEKLWVVRDSKVIQKIAAALKPVPVYIADGHHRYTTAMNYAKGLREAGVIDDQHETNFVMFCLVPRKDPGLLILPTHRMVSGLKETFTLEKLRAVLPEFSWEACSTDGVDLQDADAFLNHYGQHAMLFLGADRQPWIGRLQDTMAMKQAAPNEVDAWRELDVAILQKMVLDKALALWKTDATAVEYTPDGNVARKACEKGSAQLSICLQGTPLSAVETIADASASMPHKSTYFYPKIATGMLLKPLK